MSKCHLKVLNRIMVMLLALATILGMCSFRNTAYADVGFNPVADMKVYEVTAGAEAIYINIQADDNGVPTNVRVKIGSEVHTIKSVEETEHFCYYRGMIPTKLTGTRTVSFEVEDTYQGVTQKWVPYETTYSVNIQPLSSVSVKLDKEDCSGIYGKFVAGVNNTIKIGTKGNVTKNIDWYYVSSDGLKYCRFNIYKDAFEPGEVYTDITVSGGSGYGNIRLNPVFNTNHSWDDGTVDPQPTCTTDGVKTYKCKVCSEKRTESVPATGVHSWGSWKVTKKATCIATGTETSTCPTCGKSRTRSIPRLTSHTYDSGKITKPAKYFSTGVKTFTCKSCGATYTKSIPKLDLSKATPAKAKIKTAKVKGKKLILKWKRIAKNTKGYQIGLKDKKSGMTRYFTVKQGKKATVSTTVKKLEKGRKYAIKVRAYNIVEGKKVYGKWSTAKSGRI